MALKKIQTVPFWQLYACIDKAGVWHPLTVGPTRAADDRTRNMRISLGGLPKATWVTQFSKAPTVELIDSFNPTVQVAVA